MCWGQKAWATVSLHWQNSALLLLVHFTSVPEEQPGWIMVKHSVCQDPWGQSWAREKSTTSWLCFLSCPAFCVSSSCCITSLMAVNLQMGCFLCLHFKWTSSSPSHFFSPLYPTLLLTVCLKKRPPTEFERNGRFEGSRWEDICWLGCLFITYHMPPSPLALFTVLFSSCAKSSNQGPSCPYTLSCFCPQCSVIWITLFSIM